MSDKAIEKAAREAYIAFYEGLSGFDAALAWDDMTSPADDWSQEAIDWMHAIKVALASRDEREAPCVHAVDGPDWAGLREPTSWKERAIAAEAENAHLRGDLSENRRALDDAIKVANGNKSAGDALQAEVERMRADLHEWETVGAPAWVAAKDAQLAEAWAERDALQARLDAMTVEWGTAAVAGDDRTIHRDTFRSEDAARNARGYGESIVTRLVGPWTVVPEGDANA